MNKHLAFIPLTGLVLLTLAGCATIPGGNGANNNVHRNVTANTSSTNAVSNTAGTTNNVSSNSGNGTSNVQVSLSGTATSQTNDASEIALIKTNGYSASGSTPNATVKTPSGATLSAWTCTLSASQDGHNQRVLFFLNGKYLGTDAKPSAEIASVHAASNGIAVTYPVYKKNDSFADPTGTPVTITYAWNGSKLVSNKPYPNQFQASNSTT